MQRVVVERYGTTKGMRTFVIEEETTHKEDFNTSYQGNTRSINVRVDPSSLSKGLSVTKEAINKVGPPTEGSKVSARGARNSIESNSKMLLC